MSENGGENKKKNEREAKTKTKNELRKTEKVGRTMAKNGGNKT